MKIFHFGRPAHAGALRFHFGSIQTSNRDIECYYEYPIEWWFGISIAFTFIGIIRTDRGHRKCES